VPVLAASARHVCSAGLFGVSVRHDTLCAGGWCSKRSAQSLTHVVTLEGSCAGCVASKFIQQVTIGSSKC
jgi:hypothetical protein